MKAADKWVILQAAEVDGRVILTPHSRADLDRVLARMKNGKGEIRASLASVRSLPQLRLYWPWIRRVVENSEHFTTERGLHNMLLLGAGVVEPMIDLDGNISMIPSSIAFDAMDQEDFDRYFERAQQIVSERILPGVDLETLMKETKDDCGWSPSRASTTKPRRSSPAASTTTPLDPYSEPDWTLSASSSASTPTSSWIWLASSETTPADASPSSPAA